MKLDTTTPLTATRNIRTCELCDGKLDCGLQDGSVYRCVSGWEKQRRNTGGGGHGLALTAPFDRWAHTQCIEDKKRGYDNQMGFFSIMRE
jgi:hypothetical protein